MKFSTSSLLGVLVESYIPYVGATKAINLNGQNVSNINTLNSGVHTITSVTTPQLIILNPDFSANLGGLFSISASGHLNIFTSVGGGDIHLAPSVGDGTKDIIIFDDTSNDINLLWRTAGKGNIGTSVTVACPDNIYAKTNIAAGANIIAGGRFLSAVGSAATPAYAFSGGSSETSTGIYNIAGDTLGFSADGVLKASISITALTLADNINLTLSGTGTVTTGTGGLDGTSGNIRTTGDLNIGTGGIVLDVDSALGTVGIGTAATGGSLFTISDVLTVTASFAGAAGTVILTTNANALSLTGLGVAISAKLNNDAVMVIASDASFILMTPANGVGATTLDEATLIGGTANIVGSVEKDGDPLTITELNLIKPNVSFALSQVTIDTMYGLHLPDITNGTTNWAIRTGMAPSLFGDAIYFTQTDGNEFIDSLNNDYMDFGATTGIRVNIGGAYKYTLPVADGNADEIMKTDGSGTLSFVRMSKAIYAELSDSTDQPFGSTGTAQSILFNTNDELVGVKHSTSVDPENITIDTAGVYYLIAQPQIHASAGGAGYFHMWLQKDTGGGFADIINSNIEITLASNDERVGVLAETLSLDVDDIIRLRASVGDTRIELDAQAPGGEPAIPSIIFTMFMTGS